MIPEGLDKKMTSWHDDYDRIDWKKKLVIAKVLEGSSNTSQVLVRSSIAGKSFLNSTININICRPKSDKENSKGI